MLLFRTTNRQVRTLVPIGATRPPTPQQMGSPSGFFPHSGGRFSEHFLEFFRFSDDFMKIEFASRPELDFEGPGSHGHNAYRDRHPDASKKTTIAKGLG